MRKDEFLIKLREKLKHFKDEEIDEIINYYDEMISERVNDGAKETEVVASLGDINIIVAEATRDMIASGDKNVFKAIIISLKLCATPILIPLLIVLITIYLVMLIVWVAIVASLGAVSLAMLLAIPVTMLSNDYEWQVRIFWVGLILLVGTAFSLLTVYTCKYGYCLIKKISIALIKQTAKIIRKVK